MIAESEQTKSSTQEHMQRLLHVPFQNPCRVASWAILNGGLKQASGVAWLRVCSDDLQPPVDPAAFLHDQLSYAGLGNCVGLMTSARLENACHRQQSFGNYWIKATATAGLGNAMRIGDNPSPSGRIGTINIAVECSHGLTDEALIEGLAMITEAKVAAVFDHRISSYMSPRQATGTGTDCCVIAAPITEKQHYYCGKHTTLGHLIGEGVYHAVAGSISKWIKDNPNHRLLGGF
ncbi:adenosylcobinamide amidohydrolase [Pseudobacteriovorax antillogorgiicola]|uniref:Adenosylcobinamide hydrolase n=1 Tax=Pseudobacteriovorax antillogorgiicola TaxID=1513793 RepID=A0A1Y6C743_9BACT|nr:adenosylcobinamide amidohydrolase [Pseudobacteriovorax antillogorgiicola]TCS50684.1 adenosylcobinamide hydrolase [Pseudobacteriovorax antillogorgiicola]SMF40188.1 adenosylcobinamide hydrolase [Pseudobacteriovorax antillogorgiicola]